MNAAARKALETIRAMVEAGQYFTVDHFIERLLERGAIWIDVLLVLDDPSDVRTDGLDRAGNERWFIRGTTGVGEMELLVVLDRVAKFVTLYWS